MGKRGAAAWRGKGRGGGGRHDRMAAVERSGEADADLSEMFSRAAAVSHGTARGDKRFVTKRRNSYSDDDDGDDADGSEEGEEEEDGSDDASDSEEEGGGSDDGSDGKKRKAISVPIAMWDFNQCDSKRCTGRKLARRGLLPTIAIGQVHRGLLLSPDGRRTVSAEDRAYVEAHGLTVIDCSWKLVDGIPFHKLKGGQPRLLP